MGKGRGDDDEEEKGPDTRPQWLAKRIASSLRLKDEAIEKLMADEVQLIAITTFLDDPDCMRLLVLQDKDLVTTNNPPAKFKKKTVYFIKLAPMAPSNEEMDTHVIHGDFMDTPL